MVLCKSVDGIVDDAECPRGKPIATEECNVQACPVEQEDLYWHITDEWSDCDKQCGGGISNRNVVCKLKSEIMPLDACRTLVKPATNKECNTHTCPKWLYGSYGYCSPRWGKDSVKIRPVACVSGDTILSDDHCDSESKPESVHQCHFEPWPEWEVGEWSECSRECYGISTRSVECVTCYGHKTIFVEDCREAKPIAIKECNAAPCPFVHPTPEVILGGWSLMADLSNFHYLFDHDDFLFGTTTEFPNVLIKCDNLKQNCAEVAVFDETVLSATFVYKSIFVCTKGKLWEAPWPYELVLAFKQVEFSSEIAVALENSFMDSSFVIDFRNTWWYVTDHSKLVQQSDILVLMVKANFIDIDILTFDFDDFWLGGKFIRASYPDIHDFGDLSRYGSYFLSIIKGVNNLTLIRYDSNSDYETDVFELDVSSYWLDEAQNNLWIIASGKLSFISLGYRRENFYIRSVEHEENLSFCQIESGLVVCPDDDYGLKIYLIENKNLVYLQSGNSINGFPSFYKTFGGRSGVTKDTMFDSLSIDVTTLGRSPTYMDIHSPIVITASDFVILVHVVGLPMSLDYSVSGITARSWLSYDGNNDMFCQWDCISYEDHSILPKDYCRAQSCNTQCHWSVGMFGECSSHNDVLTRSVECLDSYQHIQDDSFCEKSAPKPATTKFCTEEDFIVDAFPGWNVVPLDEIYFACDDYIFGSHDHENVRCDIDDTVGDSCVPSQLDFYIYSNDVQISRDKIVFVNNGVEDYLLRSQVIAIDRTLLCSQDSVLSSSDIRRTDLPQTIIDEAQKFGVPLFFDHRSCSFYFFEHYVAVRFYKDKVLVGMAFWSTVEHDLSTLTSTDLILSYTLEDENVVYFELSLYDDLSGALLLTVALDVDSDSYIVDVSKRRIQDTQLQNVIGLLKVDFVGLWSFNSQFGLFYMFYFPEVPSSDKFSNNIELCQYDFGGTNQKCANLNKLINDAGGNGDKSLCLTNISQGVLSCREVVECSASGICGTEYAAMYRVTEELTLVHLVSGNTIINDMESDIAMAPFNDRMADFVEYMSLFTNNAFLMSTPERQFKFLALHESFGGHCEENVEDNDEPHDSCHQYNVKTSLLPNWSQWLVDQWSECGPTAFEGEGAMTRNATCIDKDGLSVDDEICEAYQPKPTSKYCPIKSIVDGWKILRIGYNKRVDFLFENQEHNAVFYGMDDRLERCIDGHCATVIVFENGSHPTEVVFTDSDMVIITSFGNVAFSDEIYVLVDYGSQLYVDSIASFNELCKINIPAKYQAIVGSLFKVTFGNFSNPDEIIVILSQGTSETYPSNSDHQVAIKYSNISSCENIGTERILATFYHNAIFAKDIGSIWSVDKIAGTVTLVQSNYNKTFVDVFRRWQEPVTFILEVEGDKIGSFDSFSLDIEAGKLFTLQVGDFSARRLCRFDFEGMMEPTGICIDETTFLPDEYAACGISNDLLFCKNVVSTCAESTARACRPTVFQVFSLENFPLLNRLGVGNSIENGVFEDFNENISASEFLDLDTQIVHADISNRMVLVRSGFFGNVNTVVEMIMPKYEWNMSPWSVCPLGCNGEISTRSVTCKNGSDDQCTALMPKPMSSRERDVYSCRLQWSTSEWSKCSENLKCGGVSTRSVTCVKGNTVVNMENCMHLTRKPSEVKNCQPCFQWSISGSWSHCAPVNGICSRTRDIVCADNDGHTVDDDLCANITAKPASTMKCGNDECFAWETEWGECLPLDKCGQGREFPTSSCIDQRTGAIVSDDQCYYSKPSSPRDCWTRCFEWEIGSWSECPKYCYYSLYTIEEQYQTRDVACKNVANDEIVSDDKCSRNKPKSKRECGDYRECYQWNTTWSDCTETCGVGLSVRTSVCVDISDDSIVYSCREQFDGPIAFCNTQACAQWEISEEWSECDKECGGGTSSKIVLCKDGGITVQDEKCSSATKPNVESKSCNSQQCAEWQIDEWSECSEQCDGGTRTRLIECQDADRNVLDDNECGGPENRPDASAACNEMDCYKYTTSNWSECSQICGEGIETRDVLCLSFVEDYKSVDISNCDNYGPKPKEEKRCYVRDCGWMCVDKDGNKSDEACANCEHGTVWPLCCPVEMEELCGLATLCDDSTKPEVFCANGSPCNDLDCGSNGICMFEMGSPAGCDCNIGYSGANCETHEEHAVYFYEALSWKSCTAECGDTGTKARDLICKKLENGIITVEPPASTMCDSIENGPAPTTECNRFSCEVEDKKKEFSLTLSGENLEAVLRSNREKFESQLKTEIALALGIHVDMIEILSIGISSETSDLRHERRLIGSNDDATVKFAVVPETPEQDLEENIQTMVKELKNPESDIRKKSVLLAKANPDSFAIQAGSSGSNPISTDGSSSHMVLYVVVGLVTVVGVGGICFVVVFRRKVISRNWNEISTFLKI
eukprot:TRINITY_DN492_c0_g1_i3.p1 TRINITY_DN492_c0_g1~~TRINITY_DN492_c0_g1_i3.p1  ORF type:complete len:2620 (+),score=438.40 TRINITY_DN492_c0_g1_i3:642-7862(+)